MEIWIRGASGRAGSAIATELVRRGRRVVLVGRDKARLLAVAEQSAPGAESVILKDDEALTSALAQRAPGVLVNTAGPFSATGTTARTCLRHGVHYVDLANELDPVLALLSLDRQAREAGCVLVTGAGFGVAATEAVVLAVRGEHGPAAAARVAAMPVVDGVGPAVVASVMYAMGGGGRRYVDGRIERFRLGEGFARTPLPDGSWVATLAVPTGELEAARRASGASNVIAASSELPTGRVVRAMLPFVGRVLAISPVRRGVLAAVSRSRLQPPGPSTGDTSWAHAELIWPDGTRRQGWLSTGEAYAFTARVAVEVACVLADGLGRPGAHTPGTLAGVGLIELAGDKVLIGDEVG